MWIYHTISLFLNGLEGKHVVHIYSNTVFNIMQLGSLFILCLDAVGIMTIVTIVLHQTTDHRSLPLQINHDMHDLNHRIKETSFLTLAFR